MNSKKQYEQRKLELLKILNNKAYSSNDKLCKLKILDFIENLEIYQTELLAQNLELIQKEQEIIETKDEFTKLFNFAPVAYLQLDEEFKILKNNQKALELIAINKFSLETFNQLNFYIYKDDMLNYINFISKAKSEGENEAILKFKKEDQFLYGKIYIKSYKKGKKLYYLVSIIDVTKELKQEALILSQAKNAAMGEMLSMITHQWKQPLSLISVLSSNMEVELDLDRFDKEKFKKNIDNINNQIEYMVDTSNDFKSFFDQNTQKIELNIRNCIERSIKFTSASLKNNSIKLSVAYEKDIDYIACGYKNDICQVLMTIINNAKDILKNQDGEKLIEIKVSQVENKTLITIKNNGALINDEIIEKIFMEHFTTKKDKSGNGLGLYIAKKIVTEHLDGNLFVQNLEDKSGVVFTIELPQYC